MEILFTILIMAVVAYAIMKKMYPTLVLLVVGIIVMFAVTIITQTSVLGDSSLGNIYIDVIESVRLKFISVFSGQGIVLIPVFGYAAYMMHIGASKKLAKILIKPFAKVKSPYFLVGVAVVIAGFLRIAVPAQTGLISLLMVTIYPVLVESGMSKVSAGSACVLGTTFDWGPADTTTALVLTNTTQMTASEYFVSYQLPIYSIGLVVSAILLCIINKWMDKKSGFVLGSDIITTEKEQEEKLPWFYGLLPILPLVFLILFSDVVFSSLSISAFGAVLIAFFITLILEMIRKRSIVKVFDGSKELFKGFGQCYGTMIVLVSAAGVFGDALTAVGGFSKISTWMNQASFPAIIFILLICGLSIFMTFFTASTVPATTAFSPLIVGIASSAGWAAEAVMLPVGFAMGMARAFSPISAPNIFASEFLGVNVMELIKRNLIPMICAILAIMFSSLIFIG